jgi:glutathione S-transferase
VDTPFRINWQTEATIVKFNIANIVQYLKDQYPQNTYWVRNALHYRTAAHWIEPTIDPMIRQVLPAYELLAEKLDQNDGGTYMVDLCCMCGYLLHFLRQRMKKPIHNYVGIDKWEAAIDIARTWHPRVAFECADFLTQDLTKQYIDEQSARSARTNWRRGRDAVVTNVVLDNKNAINRALEYGDVAYFGMPKDRGCGDYAAAGEELGFKVEHWDCGAATLTRITRDGNNHLRGAANSNRKPNT